VFNIQTAEQNLHTPILGGKRGKMFKFDWVDQNPSMAMLKLSGAGALMIAIGVIFT
jgi:hypothetical protein